MIRLKKDELITALEDRREWARAEDERLGRKYQEELATAHATFRAKLEEALTWSAEEAASNYFNIGRVPRPLCGRSLERVLDDMLTMVKTSKQTKYALTANSKYRHNASMFWLLTHDSSRGEEVCG